MLACQAEKKCVLKCCESMLNLLKLSHTHLKDSMATADAGDPPTELEVFWISSELC